MTITFEYNKHAVQIIEQQGVFTTFIDGTCTDSAAGSNSADAHIALAKHLIDSAAQRDLDEYRDAAFTRHLNQ